MAKQLYAPNKKRNILWGYVALLVLLFVASVVYAQPSSRITWMIAVGRGVGLVSLTMLVGQLILSSRLSFLERGIGYDTLLKWHSMNARILTLLVFIHPALVYYGPLSQLGLSFGQAMNGLQPGHYVGYAALGLIVVTVIGALYSHRFGLTYETWRLLHYLAYGIVLLGFVHGLFVSSNIAAKTWVFWWWLVLAVISGVLIVYRIFFRLRLKYQRYKVTRVVQEAREVRSIYLRAADHAMVYAPGQFAFVRFFSKGLSSEEHHFTLSSDPQEAEISFTIKELGDYTSQLDKVSPGDKALIDGPYGAFSYQGMEGPFVFIAGGVGITPLMSMLRTMAKKGFRHQVTLLYGNRTPKEVVFKDELSVLAERFSNLKVVNVYSAERVEGERYGNITQEVIQEEVTDIQTATYFICGPLPMTKGVQKVLKDLGVPKHQILTERFTLK